MPAPTPTRPRSSASPIPPMGKHEGKRGAGTLTVFVVAVFVTVLAYTVTALYFNWNGREIQDSVNTGFYSLFGCEFGITGIIQVAKTVWARIDGHKKQSDTNEEAYYG